MSLMGKRRNNRVLSPERWLSNERMHSFKKRIPSARRKTIALLVYVIGAAMLVIAVGLFVHKQKSGGESGALYHDETRSVEERVADLLGRMTIEEKIGQMALVEKDSIFLKSDIANFGIGGLLSGGGGGPSTNQPEAWLAMVTGFQEAARATRLGIPILYGVDAVHGHSNVYGATIFPQAIGLGASGDADLVRRIGAITGEEMALTGTNWNFAPTVDVVEDTRWGRTYETFGNDPAIVGELSAAYLEGLQSASIVGTAKHYLGTGVMAWGTSTNPDFKLDQGAITADEATLRSVHLPPFSRAIKAGVGSIMVGHATWGGVEIAANHILLTDVLKTELGFQGFVVSDWYGVYEITEDKYEATVIAINAGVDMVMLPYDYRKFTVDMKRALEQGDIAIERLNDAVTRILRAKFATGLFDREMVKEIPPNAFGSDEHRQVAREAVGKSLVLLKDAQDVLPISSKASRVLVAGKAADNLGIQSGGWTIEWQGIDGNWIPGTTILQGIKNSVSADTAVEYRQLGDFSAAVERADIGIAVVGETPYAEGWGDNEHPALSDEDIQTINNVKAMSKRLLVIIVSGRPLDIKSHIGDWDAVVAAWLPGSEGAGVADVIFGNYPITGKLPVDWPL